MTRTRQPVVACVGHTIVDYVYSIDDAVSPGEKHDATSLSVMGSGGAANAAVTVARLGGHALLVTRLGDDAIGADALLELRNEGVDVSYVEYRDDAGTEISTVIVDRYGGRTIVSHSDPALYFGRPPHLPDVDAVATDAQWGVATRSALRHARDLEVPSVVAVDERVPPERMQMVGELATHIVFSERGLLQQSRNGALVGALHEAQRRTDAFVAVTCSERGVFWLDDGSLHHHPALGVVAVDTNGAGDAFHAAFTLAVAEGRSESEAVHIATIAAGLKCAGSGRSEIPHRHRVEALLAGTTLRAPA